MLDLQNGMVVGADAQYDAILAHGNAWADAEDRAAEVTKANRKAYAIKLAADPERATDALYQAMAETSERADKLCKTFAELVIAARDGSNIAARVNAILSSLAKEIAEDEVAEENPERYL